MRERGGGGAVRQKGFVFNQVIASLPSVWILHGRELYDDPLTPGQLVVLCDKRPVQVQLMHVR